MSLYGDNIGKVSNSPVNLQESIQRYQNSLQYARSQLNFVVGEGLYLLPSDMNLRIGTYAGYNINILIATSNLSLGSNRAMNSESQPPSIDDQSLNNQLPSTNNLRAEGIGGDVHKDEQISLILGIAFMGGIGALIYELAFR